MGVYSRIKKERINDYSEIDFETLKKIVKIGKESSWKSSKKNFEKKMLLYFGGEHNYSTKEESLCFLTLTINTTQDDFYSKAYPNSSIVLDILGLNKNKKKIKKVDLNIASFLAQKRISKRESNGVYDLFADFLTSYFQKCKELEINIDRTYSAVAELTRCSLVCHWQKKKTKKIKDKFHGVNFCSCGEKHNECKRIWHIHMLVKKSFFPAKLNNDSFSNLNKKYYQNHGFFLNQFWIWGQVHIFQPEDCIKNYQKNNKHESLSRITTYLQKYISKQFYLRSDKTSLISKLDNVIFSYDRGYVKRTKSEIENLKEELKNLKESHIEAEKYGILKNTSSFRFFKGGVMLDMKKHSQTYILDKDDFLSDDLKDCIKLKKRENKKKEEDFFLFFEKVNDFNYQSYLDKNELTLSDFLMLCGNLSTENFFIPIDWFHNWQRKFVKKMCLTFVFKGKDYKHFLLLKDLSEKIKLTKFFRYDQWDPCDEEIEDYFDYAFSPDTSYCLFDEFYQDSEEYQEYVKRKSRSLLLQRKKKFIYEFSYLRKIYSRIKEESEYKNWAADIYD